MQALLEILFFKEVDAGVAWRNTALFNGRYRDQPIESYICSIMPQLSKAEVKEMIAECREEVRLS